MHKILVLAYTFPPAGGGGVVRIHSFVRNLSRIGWQPFVLTVKDDYYPDFLRDDSLLAHYDANIKVVRTSSLEPIGLLRGNIQASIYGTHRTSSLFERLVKPVLRTIYRSTVLPDERILWLPHAVTKGLKLIKDHDIDTIFVTTPPHSAGLVAYVLSKLSGKPFVLDVRDDWIGNPHFDRGLWHARLFARLCERSVVKKATRVIAVTQESLDFLQRKYPRYPKSKFVLIPNGFEREEIEQIARVASTIAYHQKSRLRIVYTGGLPANRTPQALFRALEAYRDEVPIDIEICIDFYGYARQEFRDMVVQMGLEDIVKFHGFIEKKESQLQLALADVALLIISQEEGSSTAIPGKIYEYMGMEKFVMALCPPNSATSRLVSKLKLGIVASPDDPEAIKASLGQLMKLHCDGELRISPQPEIMERFDRRVQAKELAEILLEVTEN